MVGRGHNYKGNRISPLQFVMLLMLRKKPMYGYELLKTLSEEFEGVWTPQTGSVYPALKKLEEHGLVRSTMKGETEYYCLSDEGENFILEGVTELPGDIQFMVRYFQILDKAASGLRRKSPEERVFFRMFDEERVDPREKLKIMRSMREDLVSKLAEVQTELEALEKRVGARKGGL
ncbi:MAG: PadR family transcriptional regulator [Methanomassiliicoccales archaeon]|nr:PadR family transcriptional regulator [Methanomassiliicoccales archaeon]